MFREHCEHSQDTGRLPNPPGPARRGQPAKYASKACLSRPTGESGRCCSAVVRQLHLQPIILEDSRQVLELQRVIDLAQDIRPGDRVPYHLAPDPAGELGQLIGEVVQTPLDLPEPFSGEVGVRARDQSTTGHQTTVVLPNVMAQAPGKSGRVIHVLVGIADDPAVRVLFECVEGSVPIMQRSFDVAVPTPVMVQKIGPQIIRPVDQRQLVVGGMSRVIREQPVVGVLGANEMDGPPRRSPVSPVGCGCGRGSGHSHQSRP